MAGAAVKRASPQMSTMTPSHMLDSPAPPTPCLAPVELRILCCRLLAFATYREVRLNEVPIWVLFCILVVLIVLSAFFSSAETGMMSLNRYRLRNLAKVHPGARRAHTLLERPDRLIGIILLGNNFVNILASSIATIIAMRLYGEAGIAIATFILTLLILIFAELAPKTLAALYPERVAFPAALLLSVLLKIFYPLVATTNVLANGVLRLLGVSTDQFQSQQLTSDEIRIVLNEAGAMLSQRYKQMLVSILDLERVTVEDIMVPRGEIHCIDLDDDEDDILEQMVHSQYTRLPLIQGNFGTVIGVLHVRRLLAILNRDEFAAQALPDLCEPAYYIPRRHPAGCAVTQLPARAGTAGAGRGRIRRRAGTGGPERSAGRNRRRIHHRPGRSRHRCTPPERWHIPG